MRQDKTVMPNVLKSIFESPDFKTSGLTEEELMLSIKEVFENERLNILNKIKNKLK